MWCEHCRDHYDEDHYGDDGHKVGAAYGPAGERLHALEMLPEMLAILKRIAAHEYIVEREFGHTFAAEVWRVIKKAEGGAL